MEAGLTMSMRAFLSRLLVGRRQVWTHHVFVLILGGAALLAACGSDAEPVAQPRTVVEPSTTTTTTTTTTTIAPPLDRDGEVRVLRTLTDVVAPVLNELDEGFVIRTPCQGVAVTEEGQVADRVHVVLDPGHGGLEPGAVTSDGIAEADVNFEVAVMAEELLEERGFEVSLTRYEDFRIPLVTRVEIAAALDAALLVSIHHQGTETDIPLSDVPGTEVYYQQDSLESRRFAGLLVEESRKSLGQFDIQWFAGVDAGATYRPNAETGGDFYGMVRLPQMPAVLAEMAFLGNEAEVDLIRTGALQEASAVAIATAIERWFTSDDPGSGFVEPSFGLRSSGGGGGLGGCTDPDLGETVDVEESVLSEYVDAAEG